MAKAGINHLKNPIFILTMLYGSGSMGIFTSFTFYYFQRFLGYSNIILFFLMYVGILLANLIGLIFGFNISKKYVRLLIYTACVIQILSFPLIDLIYKISTSMTVLVIMITGFFDALIGLYLIPKANRVKSYSSRLRHNILLWGFLYLGMSIFALLFMINSEFAFMFGMIASIIGSIGLYFLVNEDKISYIGFTRESLKSVFRSDYLSYLVLFSMYFMFFFSMVSIISFDTNYFDPFLENSLLIFLVPLLVVNAVFSLTIWYAVNKRFPLRSIFNLTYVVGSISLILIYNNPNYLIYAYILELWTWSVFQIYIFVNIGDTYPGLRNIQPINFWWFMLAISVGLGIILPIIIPDRNVLLSFMLVAMIASIALFTFLKTFKHPYQIYLLVIQSKDGHTLFEKSFSNFEFNTEYLSGVFGATNVLFKESFKSSTDFLHSIEYENKTLILAESDFFYCIAVVDRYDKLLKTNINEISNLFEVAYYSKIKQLPNYTQGQKEVKVQMSDLPAVLQNKIFALEL